MPHWLDDTPSFQDAMEAYMETTKDFPYEPAEEGLISAIAGLFNRKSSKTNGTITPKSDGSAVDRDIAKMCSEVKLTDIINGWCRWTAEMGGTYWLRGPRICKCYIGPNAKKIFAPESALEMDRSEFVSVQNCTILVRFIDSSKDAIDMVFVPGADKNHVDSISGRDFLISYMDTVWHNPFSPNERRDIVKVVRTICNDIYRSSSPVTKATISINNESFTPGSDDYDDFIEGDRSFYFADCDDRLTDYSQGEWMTNHGYNSVVDFCIKATERIQKNPKYRNVWVDHDWDKWEGVIFITFEKPDSDSYIFCDNNGRQSKTWTAPTDKYWEKWETGPASESETPTTPKHWLAAEEGFIKNTIEYYKRWNEQRLEQLKSKSKSAKPASESPKPAEPNKWEAQEKAIYQKMASAADAVEKEILSKWKPYAIERFPDATTAFANLEKDLAKWTAIWRKNQIFREAAQMLANLNNEQIDDPDTKYACISYEEKITANDIITAVNLWEADLGDYTNLIAAKTDKIDNQSLSLMIGCFVLDSMNDIIDRLYSNHLETGGTGDGDEGCIYIYPIT